MDEAWLVRGDTSRLGAGRPFLQDAGGRLPYSWYILFVGNCRVFLDRKAIHEPFAHYKIVKSLRSRRIVRSFSKILSAKILFCGIREKTCAAVIFHWYMTPDDRFSCSCINFFAGTFCTGRQCRSAEYPHTHPMHPILTKHAATNLP